MRRVMWILMVFFMPTVLMSQEFIDINGGRMTYTMISPEGDEQECSIRVKDFRMAACETTVAQWQEFEKDTGLEFDWNAPYFGWLSDLSPGDNCPVQLVRLVDVVKYCNWRSRKEGLEPVYLVQGNLVYRNTRANGYRLPTTEEWDYSARGGQLSLGFIYAGSNDPEEVAWFGLERTDGTRPVGSLKPNELGLYDMSGNVREWTWPDFAVPLEWEPGTVAIPVRGGGWTWKEDSLKLSNTHFLNPGNRAGTGFRLARNAKRLFEKDPEGGM